MCSSDLIQDWASAYPLFHWGPVPWAFYMALLDLKNVIYVDSTGAEALVHLARTCARHGVRLIVSGLMHQPLDIARRTGFAAQVQQQGEDCLQPDVGRALNEALAKLAQQA